MKRPATRFYILVLFSSMLFMQCRKEKLYDTYTGDFVFIIHSTGWRINQPSYDTSYSRYGRIVKSENPAVGYSRKDVFLTINYRGGNSGINVAMTRGKKFEFPVVGGFSGRNNLHFTITETGLSAGYTDEVTGYRH